MSTMPGSPVLGFQRFGRAGLGNGIIPVGIRFDRCFAIVVFHGVDIGQAVRRIDCIVPLDILARVRSHASEDRCHGTLGTILGLVGDAAGTQFTEQVMMFFLVTASFTLGSPGHFSLGIVNLAATDVRVSLAAMSMLGNAIPAIANVSTLAEQLGSIPVGVFHEVVIIDLAMVLARSTK